MASHYSERFLWREIFNNNFNSVLTFSRLTSSVSWRIEYLERVNALRRWKRDGPNSKGVITFKIPVPVIDTFAVDFTGLRILTYSFRFQRDLPLILLTEDLDSLLLRLPDFPIMAICLPYPSCPSMVLHLPFGITR